jgi:hypothetical protein
MYQFINHTRHPAICVSARETRQSRDTWQISLLHVSKVGMNGAETNYETKNEVNYILQVVSDKRVLLSQALTVNSCASLSLRPAHV